MEENFPEAGYVYLNSENEKRLSIYFNPNETRLSSEELKKRRIQRSFLCTLHRVVD